jgi:hypothetical protein
MRIEVVTITFIMILTLCGNVVAGSGRDITPSGLVPRWSIGSGFQTLDLLEPMVLESPADRGWVYEISPFTFFPFLYLQVPDEEGGEKYTMVYNFRGVINSLMWALTAVSADAGLLEPAKVMESPWRYVLFAPDCRVRIRLVGNLNLLLATRTDYSLFRTEEADRGILFTPHIGLDLSSENFYGPASEGGISISVGYRNWWSFDSVNRSGGLAVFVRFWGFPTI